VDRNKRALEPLNFGKSVAKKFVEYLEENLRT